MMNQHHFDKPRLEKLFDQHYGLLVSQALSFRPRCQSDLDDYIQIGSFGMIKAIRQYDNNVGRFSTFAICCIRNSIMNYLRGQRKFRYDITLDEPVSTIPKENILDYLPENLTPHERHIIQLKIDGWTMTEIGDEFSYPCYRIRRIINDIYDKIRHAQ